MISLTFPWDSSPGKKSGKSPERNFQKERFCRNFLKGGAFRNSPELQKRRFSKLNNLNRYLARPQGGPWRGREGGRGKVKVKKDVQLIVVKNEVEGQQVVERQIVLSLKNTCR